MAPPDNQVTDTPATDAPATGAPEATPAADPSADINAKIAASGVKDPIVFNVEDRFYFRKNETGDKRPDIPVVLPMPTVAGILNALNDEKQRDFILDVVGQQVRAAAKLQVDDEKAWNDAGAKLDYTKLTIEALASIPKAERTGRGIPKETWDAFYKDYIEVMPGITGKTIEQVTNAAKLFLARLQPSKTNKPSLAKLKDQLDLWFANSKQAETFMDIYDFLVKKADEFLALTDEDLTANI